MYEKLVTRMSLIHFIASLLPFSPLPSLGHLQSQKIVVDLIQTKERILMKWWPGYFQPFLSPFEFTSPHISFRNGFWQRSKIKRKFLPVRARNPYSGIWLKAFQFLRRAKDFEPKLRENGGKLGE